MDFDRSLPLKERLKKRRKRKKYRFYLVLTMMIITGIAFYFYSDIVQSDNSNVKHYAGDISGEEQIIVDDTNLDEIPASKGNEEVKAEVKSDPVLSDTPVNNLINGLSDDSASSKDISNTKVQVKSLDYSVLIKDLEECISNTAGKYGIYYLSIENDDSFGINETEEFTAASTFKVPLNLYVYKKIAEGKINPEGTLKYLKADYEDGAGILQTQPFGTKYTVRRLSELSIVKSDNVATNMLIRFVDKKNVKDFMRNMGGTVVSNSKNISCPKDMALYMKNVYEFYKSNETLGKELMNNLKNVELKDRLPALLPKEVEVAHKTGNLVGIVHDVGIVFAKKPYILAVMSKDVVSDEEANKTIANISKKVYEYVKDK